MKQFLIFAITLGFVMSLAGCQLFQKKQDTEMMETDSSVMAPVEVDDTTQEPADMPAETYATPAPIPTPKVRTHVVQPKETIFSLSRQYYGDEHQWRRIWQANIEQIADPNKIKVGQKLIIPE